MLVDHKPIQGRAPCLKSYSPEEESYTCFLFFASGLADLSRSFSLIVVSFFFAIFLSGKFCKRIQNLIIAVSIANFSSNLPTCQGRGSILLRALGVHIRFRNSRV